MAVTDYLNVITSEHREKPNFISMMTAYLTKVQDIVDCANTFDEKFSLEFAQGTQQDIIGRLLNVSRILQYGSSYSDGVLDDVDFYLVLRSKIIQNKWDGSLQDLYAIWNQIFPDTPIMVVDYQDMTTDIYVMAEVTDLQLELLNNNLIIPKTLCVTTRYFIVDKPLFAYDSNDPFVIGDTYAGYDIGFYAQEI